MKREDGRTVKGQRIRQEVRELIVAAYIELLRDGIPAPIAREIAERAGLSLRVIFKHFSDLRALRLAALQRMQAESSGLLRGGSPYQGSAARRLELFVEKHTRRLEHVTPAHRTASMVEAVDRDVAAALRVARSAARRDLEEALGSALHGFSASDKRALLMTLHMVCSWSSWDFLRGHYHLSPTHARAIIAELALAVLRSAERRTRHKVTRE